MNYYDVLELPKDASIEDIKKNYKTLAKKYHPDRNSNNDDSMFKNLTEAYSVLSDNDKRRQYDLFGNTNIPNISDIPDINIDNIFSNLFNFSNPDTFQNPNIFFNVNNISNESDIFESFTNIFDNLKNKKSKRDKNEIEEKEIEIEIREIMNGGKKRIRYKKKDLCSYCKGTCAKSPKDIIECLYCKGLNPFCLSCKGSGKLFKNDNRCIECIDGLIEKDINLSINLQKGLPENHVLIMKNKGSYNKNKKIYNDLKIKIKYKLDKNIHIYGNAIFIYFDITFKEIFCGYKKVIKILDNTIEINKDKYFDASKPIIYEGMGIPNYKDNKTFGDLVVNFNIKFPEDNNKIIMKYSEIIEKIFKKL